MVLSRNGLIWCEDERRSGVLRDPAHPLNGLDYVEYRRDPLAPPGQRNVLDATFLKPAPVAPPLVAADFDVIGGVRIVGIRVLGIAPDPADPLRINVFLDQEGDFSSYVLRVDHPGIDGERSEARFGFKAGCPTEFDCRTIAECPPEALPEPALDYLAKDYQSFRRLMVDLIAERNPGWQERLPADLGMTLVELFAYAGDYLSYFQDAGPVTEGFLDTCLHRVSAARHARLIDYRMHNGRNAVTYVHFAGQPGAAGVVPAGAKLTTRIGVPLIGATAAPGPVVPATAQFDSDPALADVVVFETTALVSVRSEHNELRIHTWNDSRCCLARGAREAHLYGLSGPAGAETAFAPALAVGDYLLLQEVLSPTTGLPADADPAHRQVVRLTAVETAEDAVFTASVPNGALMPRLNPADPALPLQRVRWREEDALTMPFCVSAETDEGAPIGPVSIARGNIAPADHGRTVTQHTADGLLRLPDPGAGRWPLPSTALPFGPLTQQAMPANPEYNEFGQLLYGRHDLERDASEVAPAVVLRLRFPDATEEIWTPVPSLLDSNPFDQHFVAEADNAGEVRLRFGDDRYGRRPLDATGAVARYRIGNGAGGNIGAGALVHVVAPDPAEPLDPADPGAALNFAAIDAVFQPLSARLGEDPETIDHVRQIAPEAFRAVQFRAVTEADWEEAALRHPGVAAAKASFRWTGSWHTVFVAVHPRDEADLRRLPGGGVELMPGFAALVRAHLRRFKLAGCDLAVRAAQYVPLEIDVQLCIARGHFRGDVMQSVARVLSNRGFADGSRGFFHPLRFSFGQPVYLSRLYAAIEAVEGVDSVTIQRFKRYWEPARNELDRGVIEMGPFEIPRLDNDANLPENGVLRLSAIGGL
ncbi:MAG: putative baseplate assembly protein [Alphaproteobacteria bacterium]